jgi:hypothetical protein
MRIETVVEANVTNEKDRGQNVALADTIHKGCFQEEATNGTEGRGRARDARDRGFTKGMRQPQG